MPIDRLVAAREAGARYLRLWAENRPEATLKLTSTASFAFAGNLADYKLRQERRPDQGNCPLNPGDSFALQPMPHLTAWEQQWLTRLAWMHGMNPGGTFIGRPSMESDTNSAAKGREKHEARVLLQYASPTGRFLMALIREKGTWKVLEPAMPM